MSKLNNGVSAGWGPKVSRRAALASALGGFAALSVAATSSAAPHSITGLRQVPAQTPDRTVEHLVIGTGYGGAVAAFRLAEAGHSVHMLEMGKRWDKPGPDGKVFTRMAKPDSRSMWFRRRTEMPLSYFLGIDIGKDIGYGPGVLDRRKLGGMNVYQGKGVGGGSLVNGGIAPRPRPEVIARQLPTVDTDEFFDTYLPRAEERLGITMIRPEYLEESDYYKFSRTGKQDAAAAGYNVLTVPGTYDFEYMEREERGEVPKSALDGQVIFGNDHGKKDLTKTYLGRAEATGRVTIDTMTEALTIAPNADGYLVAAQIRDENNKIVGETTYQTAKLYVSAGSIGTTELLLRSRSEGLLTDLDSSIGTGWGPNGNVMFGRANHLWRPTGCKHSTIPVMAIDAWGTENPCLTEVAPLPAGADLFVQLYLGIGDNPNEGVMEYGHAGLTLDWNPSMHSPSINNVRSTFDKINREQGTIYRSDLFGDGKEFSDDFTYHPLGGAVLGRACDDFGRVKGYDGLYVTDGALVPQIVGVNPFLAITALAERLMDSVLAGELAGAR